MITKERVTEIAEKVVSLAVSNYKFPPIEVKVKVIEDDEAFTILCFTPTKQWGHMITKESLINANSGEETMLFFGFSAALGATAEAFGVTANPRSKT